MTRDKTGLTSAGILLWRRDPDGIRVLLAHPGGPFWVSKDAGHWTVPKGEVRPGEALVDVARRALMATGFTQQQVLEARVLDLLTGS